MPANQPDENRLIEVSVPDILYRWPSFNPGRPIYTLKADTGEEKKVS
jgi:hypothetical protein